MKKFKKVLVGLFAILLAVVATACSNKSNSSKDGYTPKSLTIQFVPSQAANKLEARAKPLEKMLSKKLGIPVQNPTSSAGYVFPVAELEEKGLNVPKDCKLVTVTGHDQAVLNVLNGDTDAAFVFEDARNIVKKDNPKIMDQVVPIYFTKPIPNDTISIRSDMSKSFQKKLAKAFIEVGQSKEGKKIIESVYSHEGYTKSKDSNFDIVRKYDKIIAKDKK